MRYANYKNLYALACRATLQLVSCLTLTSLSWGQGPAQSAIDEAINLGRLALLSTQSDTGGLGSGVGEHALVMLALLHAGQDPQSPEIRRALRPLRSQTQNNYERAVRLMLYAKLGEPALRSMADRDTKGIVESQLDSGGWTYGKTGRHADNSVTQYALLGLRAAQSVGLQVPVKTWKRAFGYLRTQCLGSGGTAYRSKNLKATSSMTVAQLSSVTIARARAKLSKKSQHRADTLAKKAEKWLIRYFKPGDVTWPYYTLYGLQRAMAYRQQDRLGKRDWYAEGADWLLTKQGREGWWPAQKARQQRSTAFAILFLTRAAKASGRETGSHLEEINSLTLQANPSQVKAASRRAAARGKGAASQLLHFLGSPVRPQRDAAVRALRSLFGRTCGFEPQKGKTENAAAIGSWREVIAR